MSTVSPGASRFWIFVAGHVVGNIVLKFMIVRDRNQMQFSILVLNCSQEPKDLACAAKIGISFSVDDLLNLARASSVQ